MCCSRTRYDQGNSLVELVLEERILLEWIEEDLGNRLLRRYITDDHAEQVIEVMGNPSGKLPEGI